MGHINGRSRFWIAVKLLGSVLALTSIVACGGSDEEEEETPSLGAILDQAAEEAAEESGPTDLAIPALNLTMRAPGGSSVSELLGSQMISGPGLVVSVKAAGDGDPATIAAARTEADLFTPTNLADETLPDGWVLTYQNTGGMGTNYFMTARREIGGTAYMCSATVSSAEQQRAAVDACKSLHR